MTDCSEVIHLDRHAAAQKGSALAAALFLLAATTTK
jgi:hypothetical protein